MGLFRSSWERQIDNSLFSFIEIDQFKNFKLSTLWNYTVMWFLLLMHIALYGVDVYTCVRLLAFNTWTSSIKPFLPFIVSKWLFAACIIASVVLLIFEAIGGIRIYRTGNISLTYTNPFARNLTSITSYKKFCVLNEINPTGGFEKMAFHTYFTLHSSKKLLLADSPRQVINALTLWSVLHVDTKFWDTLKEISTKNRNEALILYGMSISFFIWIFFMAELFFAVVFIIPVYYNILHKMKYQTLRQFVCLKVDKTVKKLARKYQKDSLTKRNFHKANSRDDLTDGLIEKPSIPTFSIKSSQSSLDGFARKQPYNSISNSSSFDSLQPVKPYSNLRDPSRENLQTLHEKQLFESTQDRNTVDAVDVNPFRDPVIRRPMQVHQKPSTVNLLTRQVSESFNPRPYQMTNRPSETSFSDQSSTEEHDPQPFYETDLQFSQSQASFYNLGGNNSQDIGSGSQSTQTIFNTKTSTNLNFEDNALQEQYRNHRMEYTDDDTSEVDPFESDNTLKRSDVRPSLILRARDMELEDYSRYRPIGGNDSMV